MSSKWPPDSQSDPLTSRQSRSTAMLGSVDDRTDTRVVPNWLIEEQKQMLKSAGAQQPAPQAQPLAKKSTEKPKKEKPEARDNDFIMVDLLDGAHLATRPPTVQSNLMSNNTDSIISHPPIDNSLTSRRWQDLKAQNNNMRRDQRGGLSMGGDPSSHLRTLRRPTNSNYPTPNTPINPVSPYHTSLPIDEITTTPIIPSTCIQPNPNIRPDSLASAPKKPPTVPSSPSLTMSAKDSQTLLLPRPPPMPQSDISHSRGHSRRDSYFLNEHSPFPEDERSVCTGSLSNPSLKQKEKRARQLNESFQPGVWGWRMPSEDAVMPSGAWIYLPLIGFLTFFIAYSVSLVSSLISQLIEPSAVRIADVYGTRVGLGALASFRGLALVISFLFVLKVAPEYSAGSGIPEMKCVLSGVLMPRMLNFKTLVAKMVGLAFALASSISIGRLGPFIHMSGITAALVSKIPWFTTLRTSPRFQLQALSAAMAAGVGATFGAPIGGTMLSIEIMTTYYYIHWLPMALYCSVMGYYCVITLIVPQSNDAFFTSTVAVHLEAESPKRLFTYVLLGIVCGVVGAALVKFTKHSFLFRRKYFKNSTPVRTTIMLFVFAAAHTLLSARIGGVLNLGQKNGVLELINSSYDDNIWLVNIWKPFTYGRWNACLSLLVSALVKFFLTGLSLVMPVPAGTFMPIFEIGALVGRAFGEFCSAFSFVTWVDARATAIIGAAAVASGTLHTTAIAVVMLELTREAIDILPLAVGVIVSYGVSKQLCSDLFSELIKIRRLPFILGLRERYPSENKQFFKDVSSIVAGSFMWKKFPFVTPYTTKGDLVRLLVQNSKPWTSCAFLSDESGRRLWGTISQQTLWDIIADDIAALTRSQGDDFAYGTFGRNRRKSPLDEEMVPFLQDFNPETGHPLVDMGPMQVSTSTPFWKVITFFRMLSMSQMYVLKDGVTVGCLTRDQVIRFAHAVEERAKRKRQKKEAQVFKRQKEEKRLLDHFRRNAALSSGSSAADLVGLAISRQRSRQGSYSQSRR